jgi:hypothetical protein
MRSTLPAPSCPPEVVVTRARACAFFAVAVAVLGSAFGGSAGPIRPGGKIGPMTLERGTSSTADEKLFDFCNPVILRTGAVRRRCDVPRVRRLFVGYGDFEVTKPTLERIWRHLTWSLWIDGRRVDLQRFGTSDRTLYAFPPAGGKDVILREWKVTLVGATVGRHTIRYRSTSAAHPATDATWTFTVTR